MWTNEFKTKAKPITSHSNWSRVLLFDAAHKQCNSVIKGWLQCLSPESIGRFLVNNVWGLSMRSGHSANLVFFNKELKIGRPEHSLTLTALRTITFQFCFSFWALYYWRNFLVIPSLVQIVLNLRRHTNIYSTT